MIFYYRQRQYFRKGNVFTGVCLSTDTLRQIPLRQTPPGRQPPPQAADPIRADAHPLSRYPQADTPCEMATAMDGMHPTGMHNCCLLKSKIHFKNTNCECHDNYCL